jgi:hypothetical protein
MACCRVNFTFTLPFTNTHSHNIQYVFPSMATMVTRTRPNVTLHVHWAVRLTQTRHETYIFWLNRSSLCRFLWSVDSMHGFCGFRGKIRPSGLWGGRGGAMGAALLCRLRFAKSAPELHSSGSGIMLLGKNSPATIRNCILVVISLLHAGVTTHCG